MTEIELLKKQVELLEKQVKFLETRLERLESVSTKYGTSTYNTPQPIWNTSPFHIPIEFPKGPQY